MVSKPRNTFTPNLLHLASTAKASTPPLFYIADYVSGLYDALSKGDTEAGSYFAIFNILFLLSPPPPPLLVTRFNRLHRLKTSVVSGVFVPFLPSVVFWGYCVFLSDYSHKQKAVTEGVHSNILMTEGVATGGEAARENVDRGQRHHCHIFLPRSSLPSAA
ncbi:unnamed protein product [Lactuca virosa]|uniref:Uncharacterized protein n=1 Tax=Lactuca virosa TaxID=75947 RepID=A0AAU9MI98_9ASTR|nr:unnamed protein product [Lactuca virosa]